MPAAQYKFILTAGLIVAAFTIRFLSRKLVADERGIALGGEMIAWSDVTELDATKLAKGFLFVRYGPGKMLTLDSWKMQNFKRLVAFIDAHVPAEKQKR